MRIALVEDDPAQSELIASWVQESGHTVERFASGGPFQRALRQDTFDLIILDWDLPDTTGIHILSDIRQYCGWAIPVLFITVRDREEDVVKALDSGADDYLSKPVSKPVLKARLSVLERRVLGPEISQVVEAPPYSFDLESNTMMRSGEVIALTDKEFQLATYLFRNAGRLLSRAHLLAEVWGVRADLSTRTVDTHISKLRRKLGLSPEVGWRLRAIYQHGYRLERVSSR